MSALHRVLPLVFALAAAPTSGDSLDGPWQLRLSGHHSFFFGEGRFGGGLRVPWEVLIEFEIAQGEYLAGSGSARWLREVRPLSSPPGWFDCRQVDGTYLDSNLKLHETPRVRFAGFPVAGRLDQGRVTLQPGYGPPGNYLALTYECVTENPIADNWFARAELGKQVMGKRQDAEKRIEDGRQAARIREVALLPPESSLELPLRDGWRFSRGAADDASPVRYRLQRLDR